MTDSRRPKTPPLSGIGVLVTRPRTQAEELVRAIENQGGNAICFPVIEIVPVEQQLIDAEAVMLAKPDIVIFVSRNAVVHGLSQVRGASIAVIGPATADAVRAAGQIVAIEPADGFDSESLLADPALRCVAGKQVCIIRGGDPDDRKDGSGRELLADTLRQRGATVSYLSVYRRDIPDVDATKLNEIETAWRDGAIDVITVMSNVSLRNLIALLPQWCAQRLESMPLVTPAARVIKEALERFPACRAILASGPEANDMVDAIIGGSTEEKAAAS